MSEKIALVGTGLIGRGWAVVFAKAGYDVALYDAKRDAADIALKAVKVSLYDMETVGVVDSSAMVLNRISVSTSLQEALDSAVYVQESILEERELKNAVFHDMDRIADADTILASSCSTIPPTLWMEDIPHRERCIIAHPFNPPHLIPLVEIVTTPWTNDSVKDDCWALMEAVEQVPVHIHKEVPGFAVCRLQAAVISEAIHLVGEGVISPEDLDKCMKNGLGMRWAFLGPFETMELNAQAGFMDYVTKFGHVYRDMCNDLGVSKPWKEKTLAQVEQWRRQELSLENIPDRREWRDKNLMKLANLFRTTNEAKSTPLIGQVST